MSESEQGSISVNGDDLLWHHLKTAPAFRALLRATEARLYQAIDLPQPILDIGCGDGFFSQITFNQPVQFGVDTNWGKLKNAKKQRSYEISLQASGNDLPFPDQAFNSIISNSTLEHIQDIRPVLREINRILTPGAIFAFTVPSQYFTSFLSGAQLFNRMGLKKMSAGYGHLFNQISKHVHIDSPDGWAERLAQAGFKVDRWQYYFSEEATQAFEKGHFAGVPSAVLYSITGHWILGPWKSNLKWTERWARPYFEEPFPEKGAFLFFQARKVADEPIIAALPAANPFIQAELNGLEQTEIIIEPIPQESVSSDSRDQPSPEGPIAEDVTDEQTNGSPGEATVLTTEVTTGEEQKSHSWRPIITGILVGLTLMFAFWGQSALRARLGEPGSGLAWFGLSALMILALVWVRRQDAQPAIHLPSISEIPRRRWLFPVALLISFTAYRFGDQGQVLLAFIFWFTSIGIAIYALHDPASQSKNKLKPTYTQNFQFDFLASILLFVFALLPRLFELRTHPFILNGTEAGIGLDVLNILQGNGVNPFGTGWLTNPNLPNYLLAIPIDILGPTVFSLRILSPFVGAATVVALYLIGRKLYGRATGLAASILLLGSYFHVHFSRLGLTNAWDSLFVLLSLGLIAIAWQSDPKQNRLIWLFAGVATGFNAYLYTSSHLLPLILFGVLLFTLIFEPETWRKQWRHVIVMSALALVIALPQIRHYQVNPTVFMERANILGILDSQTGWLSREASQTGLSEIQLILRQLWQAGMAFNATIDKGSSFGPLVPLLNFAAGALALLGFFIAIVRMKLLRYSLLFVWITVTIIFAGALLENPPGSHRYIIAAPAVMIVAAIALVELTKALLNNGEKEEVKEDFQGLKLSQQLILLIIPTIIAAALAIYDLDYYFGAYKSEHNFADRNTEIANDMANYLNSLRGDWSAYFYGPPSMYVGFSSIPFLVQNFQEGDNLFDVESGETPTPQADASNLTFIFLPERYTELENTKGLFPGGEERIFAGYYANPLFYIYEIQDRP